KDLTGFYPIVSEVRPGSYIYPSFPRKDAPARKTLLGSPETPETPKYPPPYPYRYPSPHFDLSPAPCARAPYDFREASIR
ncbi:hypothetical protein N7519_009104, partial [Penicillium mononematosum]|uniref:uncharacterized protein n=1 Tax=Penicillium mononematosum TaxID=268346 RepID=UPI002548AB3E